MKYSHVYISSIAYTLPKIVVSSDEIEERLTSVYDRLNLRKGILEALTGVRERRMWATGTLSSDPSSVTAKRALAMAGVAKKQIGAIINGSVFRDHLEPATAVKIHRRLGLRTDCTAFDISNACLGMVNGMLQMANMIELGQIEAGIVVGTETSGQLIDATCRAFLEGEHLTTDRFALEMASLTVGSASAAIVVTNGRIGRRLARLAGAAIAARSAGFALCTSNEDVAGWDQHPRLLTRGAEMIEQAGELAAKVSSRLLKRLRWSIDEIDKTISHQVTSRARRALQAKLGFSPHLDFSTVEFLGNTVSVALPVTAAIAAEQGHFAVGDKVGFFGFGAGLNAAVVGLEWCDGSRTAETRRQCQREGTPSGGEIAGIT